ncbi:Helicase-related_protein [Hexamita inflata]|uniref:Helicase-related protein n=1 Tax=Hexamita inflata TaxID=28002 RepID=A0AA86PPN2_9EUKA|nr:Helicase-related protein [Hexamita inflata]
MTGAATQYKNSLYHLNVIAQIADKLKLIDKIFQKDAFTQLFNQSKTIIEQQQNKYENDFKNQVKLHDSEKMQQVINNYDTDLQRIESFTQQAKQLIESEANSLQSGVISEMNGISIDGFNLFAFSSVLQKLDAISNLSSVKSLNNEFFIDQGLLSTIIQTIQSRINIENARDKLKKNEFAFQHEEVLLKTVQDIAKSFSQLKNETAKNKLHKTTDQFTKFVGEVQNTISRELQECDGKFKIFDGRTIQFENYSQNIFLNLKEAQKYHNKYTEKYKSMIKSQLDQIKNLIEFMRYFNTLEVQMIMEQLEKLPFEQEIVIQIQNQIENCKQEQVQKQHMIYQQTLPAQSLKQIVELYVFYSKQTPTEYYGMQLTQLKIQEKQKETANVVKNQVEKTELHPVFIKMNMEWNEWTNYLNELKQMTCQNKHFQNLFTDTKTDSMLQDILQKVAQIIQTSIQKINVFSNTLELNQENNNNSVTLTKLYDNLKIFADIMYTEHNFALALINTNNKTKNVTQIYSKLLQIFENITKNFNVCLSQQTIKIQDLNTILEVSQQAEALHNDLLKFSKEQACQKYDAKFKAFINTKSFTQMKDELMSLVGKASQNIQKPFLNEATQSINAQDRDKFYSELYVSFTKLQQFQQVKYLFNGFNAQSQAGTIEYFKSQMLDIFNQTCEKLKFIPHADQKFQQNFNSYYDNLRSIKTNFQNIPELTQLTDQYRTQIVSHFQYQNLELKMNALQNTKDMANVCETLILYKSMTIDIPEFTELIAKKIDQTLKDISAQNQGANKIIILGNYLTNSQNQYAKLILQDNQQFQGRQIAARNDITGSFTIEDILSDAIDEKLYEEQGIVRPRGLQLKQVRGVNTKLEEVKFSKEQLNAHYKTFRSLYEYLVNNNMQNKQQILDAVKIFRQYVSQQTAQYIMTVQEKIQLMAYIFAYFTASNSDYFQQSQDKDQRRYSLLLQPHAAQIIAIMALIGIPMNESSQNILKNQLSQVLTGEGKSIILAATAIIFVIMGYDVHCACYSEYLSKRDYDSFLELFTAFQVQDNIVYGTFNQICEIQINKKCDIRDLTRQLIESGTMVNKNKQAAQRPQILMIDEVDVFFNKDFYGNVYQPMAKIQDKYVQALIDYIWKNKDDKEKMKKTTIMDSPAYKDCCSRVNVDMLNEALKDLMNDVRTFHEREYIVHNGLIGYKDQDKISTTITYGYQTLFAYYEAVGKNQVKPEELNARKCLYFSCGNYSYAEIPEQYNYIIGVTGTLETLTNAQMEILTQKYRIQQFSFIPSVFGYNKLDFQDSKEYINITPQKSFFIEIVKEINKRKKPSKLVPVLVFFESRQILRQFYDSEQFKSIHNYGQIKILDESVSTQDKDSIVKQAVQQGNVTLITKELGRGTDFICYDKSIDALGGVHVIQTFFSDELSEEVQIKGRTARQSSTGSYSMVLLDSDLEKYQIGAKQVQYMHDSGKYYSEIDPKRRAYFDEQYPEMMKFVKVIMEDHQKAQDYLSHLQKNKVMEAIQFLTEKNKCLVRRQKCKTLLLLDATLSMDKLLEKTKETIKTVFSNAYEILMKKNYDDPFEMMVGVYRNYADGKDDLFQHSAWESKPDSLKAFIDNIDAKGGSQEGQEAIEVGLNYANQERNNGLNQVIIIGDAPPNSKYQIKLARKKKGDNHWIGTEFENPCYYQDELKQLKEAEAPVHTLFMKPAAEKEFKEISRETNGESKALNIEAPNAAEDLQTFIAEKIMQRIGGDDFVSAYRAQFRQGNVK